MDISTTDLETLTTGTAYTETDADGYFCPHRFTKRNEDFYHGFSPDSFEMKAFATAGVTLRFSTDAAALSFDYATKVASSRKFNFFDITVDGALVAHIGKEYGIGDAGHVELPLPAGTHTVCVCFPALAAMRVKNVSLAGAAFCTPVKRARKLYCVGDSITQGYDAYYPTQTYAALLADLLEADLLNHAIGGEEFRPDMLDPDLPFDPDIITVAYGTNDWSHCERAYLIRSANEFFARLRAQYPKAQIFAITPTWRADNHRVTKVGPFAEAGKIVRAAAEAQGDITVIEGENLVPHLSNFFSDAYLHPNDAGFRYYADALYRAMRPHLK